MMADRRPSTASHKHLVTIIWHADVITRIGSNLLPVFCGLLLLLAVQGNAAPHPILDAASHLDRDRGLLRFDSGGSFKILQLTDLHFGESASKDRRSVQVHVLFLFRPSNVPYGSANATASYFRACDYFVLVAPIVDGRWTRREDSSRYRVNGSIASKQTEEVMLFYE
jgi:hypothetical protein